MRGARRSGLRALALGALLLLPAAAAAGGLARDRAALAERLFLQLETARAEQRDRAVLELAFELTDHYEGFRLGDRALFYAVGAAARLGDRPLARQLAREFLARHPGSSLREAVAGLVDGDPDEGVAVAPAPPAPAVPAAPPASPPSAPARAPAATVPPDFAVPAPARPPRREAAPVAPDLVGVLLPAADTDPDLGAALRAAAALAAAHAAREGWRAPRVEVADAGDDGLEAAVAARSFLAGEGAVVLVSALAPEPTATAAALAEAWGAALVAGGAADERLAQLGPGVIATGRTVPFEARLLAGLAVDVLGKPRVALLHPATPAGEADAAAVAAAVAAAGGSLAASVACADPAGDCQASLRLLAAARPELVVCVAGASAAPLLAPQFDFAGVGALLAGPSAWADPELLRAACPAAERMLLPDADALWPPAWRAAFARDWTADAWSWGVSRDAFALYAAVRLSAWALSLSGTTPTRARVAEVARQRWDALLAAPLTPADCARGVRMVRGGRAAPFPAGLFAAAPAPAGESFAPADTAAWR